MSPLTLGLMPSDTPATRTTYAVYALCTDFETPTVNALRLIPLSHTKALAVVEEFPCCLYYCGFTYDLVVNPGESIIERLEAMLIHLKKQAADTERVCSNIYGTPSPTDYELARAFPLAMLNFTVSYEHSSPEDSDGEPDAKRPALDSDSD